MLAEHFHWTWRDLQETPAPIVEWWSLYRTVAVQVQNQRDQE